ncbi:MAG TPA: FliG C-terminal domain-containing protein [Anaeromyxobacter sp.]|nr:FliG C-terminal domain-containing protein [Anaeromyxobacter sp.]
MLAIALAGAAGARAAESGDRIGSVVASRIELQRLIGDWLTKCLAGTAEPYRVEAIVQVEMRGSIRELRSKQESGIPSVKIGGKNRVKLPGLGMVDGGGGQGNIMPEISIDGGSRVSETVTRQVETEVSRLKVMLFVDPSMPKERRDLLVQLVSELAGIDRARGDEVQTREWPESAKPTHGATVVQATIQSKVPWEVIAVCVSGILAAFIVSRGIRGARGASVSVGGGRGGAEGGPATTTGGFAVPATTAEAEERRKRREELGAFKALADATPREIVQVIAEADPHTACAIADLVGFDAEAAKLVEEIVPAQRRIEIGIGLATARVLTRDQLTAMENAAAQVLQRIRNRVPLGGSGKLAEFLAIAPDAVRREVLEGVAARDPNLAQAARESMYLFEDLPRLSDATVRQVVTGVDPSVVALALVGAPDVRDVIHAAVSKRLRSILEVEEEVVQEKPAAEIEGARRVLEEAMRQLNLRGEIRARAA